jgi:dTDP-4-amino-4,6-dideoxygalactose transaminase
MLAGLPLVCPWQSPEGRSAFHLYPVCLAPGHDRARVFAALREAGIGVNVHYIPVHLQPVYQQRGFKRGNFPQAEAYYDAAISLPLYASMTFDQQDQVVTALKAALEV